MIEKIKKIIIDPYTRFAYLSKLGLLNWMSDEKYLKKKYYLAMNKTLNLDDPRTYNEKLQWLKIHDRKDIYTKMVDKYAAKKYVANIVGKEHVIPTLGIYEKFDDIDFDELPKQFVIKCTHDSGGLVVCRDKNELDKKAARKKINGSLRTNYYYKGREWQYKNVKPRILIEKYIDASKCDGGSDCGGEKITASELQKENGLLDYKFMCFNGVVKCLFLDIGVIGKGTGHAEEYYRNVYDKNFKLMPVLETRQNYPKEIMPPKNFKDMVAMAEKLSKGVPHVRVDLYNVDGKILFGEMTFYHGSGFTNYFKPIEWDEKFGDMIDLTLVKK